MENIKEQLVNIKFIRNLIDINNKKQKNLKEENESYSQILNDLTDKSNIKKFIADKLQDAIDKFDLNKNKEKNDYNISTYASCSTGGEYEEHEVKTLNPNKRFNPYEDKWEIASIELKDNRYKVKVENINGRKFLNAFMWEPDYYETDWFEI